MGRRYATRMDHKSTILVVMLVFKADPIPVDQMN